MLYHANQLDAQAATRPVGDDYAADGGACWRSPAPSSGASATSSAASPRGASPSSSCSPSRRQSGSSGVVALGPRRERPVPRRVELLPAAARGSRRRRRARRSLPRARDRRDGDRRADLGRLADRAARGRRAQRDRAGAAAVGRHRARARRDRPRLARAARRRRPRSPPGAGLALVAALGFGLFFVGIDAAAEESAPWAVVAARSASVSLASSAVARHVARRCAPPRRSSRSLVGVGVFDTGANVLVAFATTRGRRRRRRRPQRALPARHDPARPPRARRAAEPTAPGGGRGRARRRGAGRRRLTGVAGVSPGADSPSGLRERARRLRRRDRASQTSRRSGRAGGRRADCGRDASTTSAPMRIGAANRVVDSRSTSDHSASRVAVGRAATGGAAMRHVTVLVLGGV